MNKMKFENFNNMYESMKKDINEVNRKNVYISQDYDEWLNEQYSDRIYDCEDGILSCCRCVGKDKCSHYRLKAVNY